MCLRSFKAGSYRVQWQYKLFYILPHSPPMGVPVLWQDGPVVQFSHFLVSNVPSKFYRLDLDLDLDLVFFLNSKDQQKVLRFSLYCHARWLWWDEDKEGGGGGGASPQSKKEQRIPQKNKIMPQKICPNMDRLLENSWTLHYCDDCLTLSSMLYSLHNTARNVDGVALHCVVWHGMVLCVVA